MTYIITQDDRKQYIHMKMTVFIYVSGFYKISSSKIVYWSSNDQDAWIYFEHETQF